MYSVLGKRKRGEDPAEKWAHEKEQNPSPSPERQLLGEGSPSPKPQSPVVTPTPTDVLMEEEEEEGAKKTEEEKGKEKDTETAEAEGGRKGAEAGGGGVAKQPEGVTTRSRSTRKRRVRDTGAGEEGGQRAVVERPHFVMGKHLQIVESTIGEGRGVKTRVDIEADTCLGEYKGERIGGTAPDCLTGRGDKVLCIKGGQADSKTGRGVWVDGGKRENILSRINARPRLEDCNVIIHLDDGTPRVYTRREVKPGTELAMFYGVDYPLPPSPPPADAADPDEPAAEGSNQPVLTTQNILPSASALPAGQLYGDDGSLVGRQYFSSKSTYPSQATVTHVDGGQFIVRKGDRVRLLWSEVGGPHLTQVESKTCCFKRNWRKGRFVMPLTTVWGDQNYSGGDFITAGSQLAGVYPPWFCYEFEGAAPRGVVEMVFVGGKWEVISVQNRKDVYGRTGQWLQVGINLRGYDAEYQAAARGIRQKTFFVRAEVGKVRAAAYAASSDISLLVLHGGRLWREGELSTISSPGDPFLTSRPRTSTRLPWGMTGGRCPSVAALTVSAPSGHPSKDPPAFPP